MNEAFARLSFSSNPMQSAVMTAADYAFEEGFLGKEKPDLKDLFALNFYTKAVNKK